MPPLIEDFAQALATPAQDNAFGTFAGKNWSIPVIESPFTALRERPNILIDGGIFILQRYRPTEKLICIEKGNSTFWRRVVSAC